MSIRTSLFGKLNDGRAVTLFALKNSSGNTVSLINFGAAIVEIIVPDKNGRLENVNLAYGTLDEYVDWRGCFGAVVGRCANRISNHSFTLNGKTYELFNNSKGNSLHGGEFGFDKKLWDAESWSEKDADFVRFTYFSPDGEENYPGNLTVSVVYSWNEQNELKLEYYYSSDADTVASFTNHTYFNLERHDAGDIRDHIIEINASHFTPLTEAFVPEGILAPVDGTPYDFRKPLPFGARIDCDHPQIVRGGGYDINYAVDGSGFRFMSAVTDPKSGRKIECFSDLPGVQLYTANNLSERAGIGGCTYRRRGAFCLETQYFPNAVNTPSFESTVIKAGEKRYTATMYRFTAK